jgi:hypothetical protein
MRAEILLAGGTLLTVLTADRARIPTGACVQPDGKKRMPRPPCDKNGKGPYIGPGRDGKPLHQPCDKPGDCKPELLADPIMQLAHTAGVVMVVIGAAAVLTRKRR